MKKVLIVGAGTLGQVFGMALARGGAEVHVLVRPAHAPTARNGYLVYQHRGLGRLHEARFAPAGIHTSPEEVAATRWDAVWLCVHSTSLTREWLERLRAHVGTATIVTIGQGPDDLTALRNVWADETIVRVVPSMLAYHTSHVQRNAPRPGTAFWIPLGGTLQVSGTRGRAEDVADALRRGRLRSRNAGSAGQGDVMAAATMPFVAALERAGWSLHALPERLPLAARAAREATRAVARQQGVRPPPTAFLSPRFVRRALVILARVAPFDFERYLRVHFSKVATQTRQMLAGWLRATEFEGLPGGALKELMDQLERLGREVEPDVPSGSPPSQRPRPGVERAQRRS